MIPWLISSALAAPIPVEVVQTDAGWQILRDGQPTTVRGAGGAHALDQLVAIGGSSIRTWGVGEETAALLDQAHELGLTVSLGIWLGHPRHGFDYGDPDQLARQLDEVRAAVQAYKDHPAVLLWGVGNEMEGFEQATDPRVWQAVCDAAALVQELDPHHPVMTTTADIGGDRVAAVDACPHIDLHGVNSYGGAPSLPDRFRAAGGRKPLMLTEYGPPGVWELPKTDYGAVPEPTSTAKAESYARVWNEVIVGDPLVVGGYAFLWAWKTEATATWFGLFLPDGTRLGAVDALAEAWGQPVPDRAPVVTPLVVEGGDRVKPGSTVVVRWTVSDPEGMPVDTRWTLRREIQEQTTGGDTQALPGALREAVLEAGVDQVRLRLPRGQGVYRLYAEARDPAGGGATASLPLLVGEVLDEGDPLPMPWFIYQDQGVGGPWVPSGHMGDAGAFTLDLAWTQGCASPPSCIRIDSPLGAWSGVAWQIPANNWGSQPGGLDLSQARWLRFKVRGSFGWGSITAGVGLVDEDQPHPDSLKVEETISLTPEWQDVRIRLRGDRSHVITGFWWVLPPQRPVTVFIDDVVLE